MQTNKTNYLGLTSFWLLYSTTAVSVVYVEIWATFKLKFFGSTSFMAMAAQHSHTYNSPAKKWGAQTHATGLNQSLHLPD